MIPNGLLVSSSQTVYILALNFDILPEALQTRAAERLVENIKGYNYPLTTGFLVSPIQPRYLTGSENSGKR